MDGISLGHRSWNHQRTHIWSFASGLFNGTAVDGNPQTRCPCDPGNPYGSPPFVGDDYFCDSVATADSWNDGFRFFPDNALWDGQDLLNQCYGLNNPPWFYKTLPEPTTKEIELTLCLNTGEYGNIAIQLLEIYVH